MLGPGEELSKSRRDVFCLPSVQKLATLHLLSHFQLRCSAVKASVSPYVPIEFLIYPCSGCTSTTAMRGNGFLRETRQIRPFWRVPWPRLPRLQGKNLP